MNEEEKEPTLEELQEQLEVLQAENADLKAKLEEVPEKPEQTEEIEQPEETENKEQTEVKEVATEEVAAEEAPAPEDDKEAALQTRLEALWNREVKAELKEAGLEKFAEFLQVEVDDSEGLRAKIKALQAILEDYKITDSYQPRKTAVTVDEFARAKANKDPRAMLKARL